MKKIIHQIAIILFFASVSFAQTPVTVNSTGGAVTSAMYPDLKSAFDTINSGYQTGDINIFITGNVTQSTTARLDSSGRVQAWGTSSYTSITISPLGGTYTISGAIVAGSSLIHLNGADNVTINGMNNGTDSLIISNTTVSATSGTCTILLSNDATNNTIRSTTILGAATMSTTTNGGTIFISTAAPGGFGNDNNTITNCYIANNNATNTSFPYKHVYINGTTTNVAIANSGIVIDSNKFVNFRANGVYSNTGVTHLTVSNNHFYHTATLASSSVIFAPIWVSNISGENFNINGNFIGGSAPFCGGTTKPIVSLSAVFQTIYLNCATSSPSYINGNKISNLSITTSSTTVSHSYIFMNGGRIDCGTQKGNIIGTTADTSDLILTYSSTSASNFNAFGCAGANTTPTFDTIKIENNVMAGFSLRTTSTSGISMRFFDPTGSTGMFLVRYNTFGSPTVANSIRASMPSNNCFGFLCRSSSSGYVHQFVGNYFVNISLTSTAGGNLTGISLTNATNWRVDSNVFEKFTNYSTSTGVGQLAQLVGINYGPTGNLGSSCIGNTIKNFTSTHPTAKTTLTGIGCTGTTTATTTTVMGNRISGLNSLSADTSTIVGLFVNTAPGNSFVFANNEISLGLDSAGNTITNGHPFWGIQRLRGTSNFYYNSILVSGVNVGNNANTYAMFTTDTGGTRDFRNNVFSNTRSFATLGTTKNIAAAIAGTVTGGLITGLTIDYNLYYAPNVGGTLITNSGTDYGSVVSWNANASSHDVYSASGDPLFFSTTQLQGQAGTAITVGDPSVGITNDILGNTRVIFLRGAYDALSPIPVKYFYVKAEKQPNDVLLEWATASEINNKGFMIERSMDGVWFKEIAFVAGAGKSVQVVKYSWRDIDVLTNEASSIYYRLKQVDFDGRYEYSRTIVVDNKVDDEKIVFPNPFNNRLTVKCSSSESRVNITITDIHGKTYVSQQLSPTVGMLNIQIDNLEFLQKGLYLMKVESETTHRIVKLIKE